VGLERLEGAGRIVELEHRPSVAARHAGILAPVGDLFDEAAARRLDETAPLAVRLRPSSLDELVGQPFRFSAVPAPIRGLGTFPVRAFAELD